MQELAERNSRYDPESPVICAKCGSESTLGETEEAGWDFLYDNALVIRETICQVCSGKYWSKKGKRV